MRSGVECVYIFICVPPSVIYNFVLEQNVQSLEGISATNGEW